MAAAYSVQPVMATIPPGTPRSTRSASWLAAVDKNVILVALRFLYGVGGCAPWGPSLLRSQARFALPPAPTLRTCWAAAMTLTPRHADSQQGSFSERTSSIREWYPS